MSIQVKGLTKHYGLQKAVNNISFSVQKGEIVGFLGPNGAGKSTTMKIATGYLPPSEGMVSVCGFDVVNDPLAVKRVTGYLPEHNPLYLDMYVHEYLNFAGGVLGLKGEHKKKRMNEMVGLCGLELEQNKKIESLSKGYRQRVGLAASLIHDPQVLILDEPTSGLDPNQIVEIRKVIKDISKNKTVIFSTHIMQEVQALCDRVIVINRGEVVADDQLVNLLSGKDKTEVIVVEFDQAISLDDMKRIEGVEEVTQLDGYRYRIAASHGLDLRPAVFHFAADKKLSLLGLKKEDHSLETIFRELTKSEN
ncbi:MAG TPA: gliding motility-associated ABC transporter ATP-binding subunit GldA [Cyclobacteriaceae bacterium]